MSGARRALLVTAIVAAVAAGCGSDEPAEERSASATRTPALDLPTPTPEPVVPEGDVPAGVRGVYVMRSERGDGLPYAGRWRLRLTAGKWTLSGARGERNAGTVSGDARSLAFVDDCTDEPGLYSYRLSGGVLELEAVEPDPCEGREIKLTWSSQPWRRG